MARFDRYGPAGDLPGPRPAKEESEEWTAKLAVAPGTVYGNTWEKRKTDALELRVTEDPTYAPPFEVNPANPQVYLDFRSGGVSLGRVVIELKEDVCPITTRNFMQLCEFRVYKGCIVHRIYPDFIVQGGDYHRRCNLVCPPDEPDECFDLSLVEYSEGGRSIYSDRPDGLFDDENFLIKHIGRGILSMSNSGPNTNGSQFFFTVGREASPHLDGKYVAFGQVLSGIEVLTALGSVGRKVDASTTQRVVIEECGVLKPSGASAGGAAAGAAAAGAASAEARGPRAPWRAGGAGARRGAGRGLRSVAPLRADGGASAGGVGVGSSSGRGAVQVRSSRAAGGLRRSVASPAAVHAGSGSRGQVAAKSSAAVAVLGGLRCSSASIW